MKKFNICSAVNDLLEFLNYWFYRASEKEKVAPKFSTKKKTSPMMSPFLVRKFNKVVTLNVTKKVVHGQFFSE